jgi:microcystin-dependent protein
MRKILALVLALWAAPVTAQIVGTLPFTLQNGTIADANQVMSDLNTIVAAVNANAANAGINTNINALNNLTTPLVYTSGGTSNYIGGTSGGSANAQTVASPIPSGFTLVTGKSTTFLAGFTNTGPTTLNVASTGATNVFKQGASGPVALSGSEFTAGNLYTATFDGTQYQITTPAPQSLVAPCTLIDWPGVSAPSGYLRANGAAVSRTTFSGLYSCLNFPSISATTSSGSTTVTLPGGNAGGLEPGWAVGGNNVTCNSVIQSIPDGSHIVLNVAAGANGATTLSIGPYPQGDCSTTFNLPSLEGRVTAMRDTGGSVLTGATCTNASTTGPNCGAQTQTLVTGNLPPYTPAGTISTVATANVGQAGYSVSGGGTNLYGAPGTTVNLFSISSQTFTGTAQSGTSTPFSNLQPTALVDKYIKF